MLRNTLIQIKVLDVLKDLGIEYKAAGSDNVKIKCLNPNHVERNPSMHVHKETGAIHCFGCFDPSTPVVLRDSIVAIESVKIGDSVLTHNGNFNKVLGILEKEYSGNMVEFSISKEGSPIVCTEDHKFFIYKNEDVFYGRFKKGIDKRKKGERVLITSDFKESEAKDINIDDWVYIPKIKEFVKDPVISIDVDKYKKTFGKIPKIFKNNIKVTKDVAWLIGLYIAEGSLNRGALFNINNTTKKHLVRKIYEISKSLFDIECKEYLHKNSKHSLSVLIPNVIIGRWLDDICGHTSINKKVPFEFLSYPKEILESLIEGYYLGDGYISRNGLKTAATVSKTLAYQLKIILCNLGFSPSLRIHSEHIDKNGVNHKKSFIVSWWIKESKKLDSIILEDKILYRIVDKKIFPCKNRRVFDLTVERDHSYTVNGIAVHNCHFKGNLFTLLNSKGLNFEESKNYLKKFLTGGNSDEEVRKFLENFINSRSVSLIESENKEIVIPGHRLLETHPYLSERGITPKEIVEWKMGSINDAFNIEFKRYFGWILIPIYQKGILRNYFMRSTFGSGKEYGSYGRNDLLFGIDKFSDTTKKIYITEGIFDSIFFMRTRNQCVAALSNRLLPDQIKLLRLYKEVVIVPDNDLMGEKLIQSAHQLIHATKVSICFLPKHRKDAADCTIEELVESTYKEVSINQYFLEKKYGTNSGQIINDI